ncbi:hypothetical protein ONZ45_g12153 [Pleurotus djamor]|nr:hypothetical protein ONZ45_g12153 [Pleurotus djamor]
MDATLTITQARTISKLPPEVLFQAFSLLWDEFCLRDVRHLCLVCRSWHSIAQVTLYRSVILLNSRIREFAIAIKENEHLALLVEHLTLDPMSSRSDWVPVHKILRLLSPHETLLSFHLPALAQIDPESVEFTQSISFLSFLGHLDVAINIFESLHAVKRFIASFPHLHTLDVNDKHSLDVTDEWLEESASDGPIEFPPTIRRVGYHISVRRSLDAFLQWVLPHMDSIQSFSATIGPSDGQASLASTLRSFGAALTSLRLFYHGPSSTKPPSIDLHANPNLRSLAITVISLEQDGTKHLKEHLCTVLRTLSLVSLRIVEFNLVLESPISPRYDFMDWGALDTAVGNARVRISVLCREKSDMAGVEEGIIEQMPQHRGQRNLQMLTKYPPT